MRIKFFDAKPIVPGTVKVCTRFEKVYAIHFTFFFAS